MNNEDEFIEVGKPSHFFKSHFCYFCYLILLLIISLKYLYAAKFAPLCACPLVIRRG